MVSARQSKKARKSARSTEKGRLVEAIVARMHMFPDATVEMNAYLPAISSADRRREIDVLISGSLAGYPVRIAIECKNYGERIEVQTIDAFVGKLDDVGIPRQHGIIVTVSGFTDGAIQRATFAGVRPLVLTGLTDDRLAAEVATAFMSLVYLLPVVTGWRMVNSVPSFSHPSMMFTVYDTAGVEAGTLLDLVWWRWRDGVIPSIVGTHKVPVALPSGWHMRFEGKPEVPISITYEITVYGLVLVVSGAAAKYGLLNAASGALERLRIETQFTEKPSGRPLAALTSEDEVQAFLKQQKGDVSVVGRVRLPRIRSGPLFWPLSARARSRIDELLRPDQNGNVPDPDMIDWAAVEGSDLEAVFDPIWKVPRRAQ